MNGIYLVIGGNMGDRELFLSKSLAEIAAYIGEIVQLSAVYETASWGNTDQRAFLNQVVYVKSALSAKEVLVTCLQIEQRMGRVREEKWGSRTIDIDLLFFNHELIEEEDLKIPHPFLHQRRFVLVPMNEIASTLSHPVLHKTIRELLHDCEDTLPVIRYEPQKQHLH